MEIISNPNHETVREVVSQWLSSMSRDQGYEYSPVAIALEATDSQLVIGGLYATTNYEWLHIELLAVDPEHRGQGIGRDLVFEAEGIARQRGCFGSWVDTFTFQSPNFYLRLGYEVFGTLPGYPGNQSRVFLRKFFSAA